MVQLRFFTFKLRTVWGYLHLWCKPSDRTVSVTLRLDFLGWRYFSTDYCVTFCNNLHLWKLWKTSAKLWKTILSVLTVHSHPSHTFSSSPAKTTPLRVILDRFEVYFCCALEVSQTSVPILSTPPSQSISSNVIQLRHC